MSLPNLLLINCHDLGRHLGAYGVATVDTPNLDRLAEGGVLFENAFCTHPTCSPSRASLFTGLYPHSTGVLGLTASYIRWRLDPARVHLAQILGRAGYRTVLAGLFHEHDPEDFDRLGYDERLTGPATAMEVAAAAAGWLKAHALEERPFFLTVGFTEPHRPFDQGGIGPDSSRGIWIPPYIPQASEDQREAARTEFAALQGALREVDLRVGEILAALDAQGAREKTLVVFTTDHGIAMPGAKGSLHDPGIGIALIMNGRMVDAQGGRRLSHLVSNVDIVPTLVEALGLAPEEELRSTWQGRSFTPILRGEDGSRNAVFCEKNFHNTYDPIRCIRTDRYKLIVNFEMGGTVVPGDVQVGPIFRASVERFTPHRPAFELYDLEEDPQELVNLAGDPTRSRIEGELTARLRSWMADTSDPLLEGPIVSPYYEHVIDLLDDRTSSQ